MDGGDIQTNSAKWDKIPLILQAVNVLTVVSIRPSADYTELQYLRCMMSRSRQTEAAQILESY